MGWPKGKPMRRVLTEEDLAFLATAPEDVPTTELAQRLGKPYFTVAHARQKLRREGGWLCRLVWRTCTECAAPVCSGTAAPRTAHPWCEDARQARYSRERRRRQPGQSTPYVRAWRQRNPARLAVMREQEKAQTRAKWPLLPPEVQEAMLDKLHAADRRDYQVTVEEADRLGATWTSDEDQYVLDRLKEPAREVALVLGRTLWGVRGRRVRLRRELTAEEARTPG